MKGDVKKNVHGCQTNLHLGHISPYLQSFNQTDSQILLRRQTRTAAKTVTIPDGDYCYE